jgi:protein-disulfide isomerase
MTKKQESQKNKTNKYMAIFLGFLIVTIVAFVATRYEFGSSGNLVTEAQSPAAAKAENKVTTANHSAALSEEKSKLLKDTSKDNYMGKEYAPVVMIEYASLSCPHCQHFHDTVVEKLIPTYIESGKLKYVYRDFLRNKQDLTAAMITHCVEKDRYFGFIKAFFKSQDNWAFTPKYEEVLRSVAKLGGVTEEKFNSCQSDKEMENNLLKIVKEAQEILEVNSTPTIFINGNHYTGDYTFEGVSKYIDEQLKGE